MNMTLYRLLLKGGASEPDAEAAARIDTSDLATKADLSKLEADLTWRIVLAMGAQTALIGLLFRVLQR